MMMDRGWRYRFMSLFGAAVLPVLGLRVATSGPVRDLFSLVPLVGHLPFSVPGGAFEYQVATVLVVFLLVFVPFYKPRPQRALNITLGALHRVVIGLLALATIGYFDFSFRLPRATLLVTGAFLLVAMPAWFLAIRRRPRPEGGRRIIVGDDPETIEDIVEVIDGDVLGYVSPPSAYSGAGQPRLTAPKLADGGTSDADELACLGGLSRLDEILVNYDIGTAILAFARPDRTEFFGALDACYEHGVAAKVHRDHGDAVLTTGRVRGPLVDIDLEPWDWQDNIIKRAFDIVFAGAGLIALLPVIAAISIAIKVDDSGPVLYHQTRTAAFGDTFTVSKFRTMAPGSEDAVPTDGGETEGITRVGSVLRRTHLDEIPQLWTILKGDMSVVGPRAAWVDEEALLEEETTAWRRRWFVKPGLTGLAQINDVSSTDPKTKLRYDVEYIHQQSFWFDLKIIVRQIGLIGEDVAGALVRSLKSTP